MPRFGQAFNEHCEQNFQDTLQLKQRFLDAKAKRVPKNKDRKQDSIQSSVHVQQKFLKRSNEESDPSVPGDNFEPPVKLQCTTGSHPNEGLTKFSVEIVQQLEFTTSAANSQPQQISTNVTVKAHTNASVKSDVSSPKAPTTPAQKTNQIGLDVGTLVECVKQEPDNDFADLDQCAAALEKDAAANGGSFGGFSDLIGDDTNDEIITSDAFNDLISDISNYPELMKDFDFEDKSENGLKVEEQDKTAIPNSNFSPPVFDQNIKRIPYSNLEFCKTELSPAAQTLKQMAEQHQHKNQMGINFNPNRNSSRSPYSDFQFQNDYSPNSNPNFHKNSPNFNQSEMIKQEMIFQGNDFEMKRKGGIYKQQQYSPYSSPSASSHGSPGYLPRSGNTGSGGGPFGGGTPPRPSSGPGGNQTGTTLQINQAQQLHINQQNHGHAIQVSAGQHLHLSGDLKGNVSIATQQGMHFNQSPATSQSSQNIPQSPHQPQPPQMHQPSQPQSNPNPPGSHLSNPMMSNPQQPIMQQHLSETYNMSQTQTINFTQQTLRQRAPPNNMPAPRFNQNLDQQKLLQQQQMLRAQQAALQQHMGARPPPPDYKSSAGMMQARFTGGATGTQIRRMPHQAMPPSGPMIRPHTMYMMQQQQQQHMMNRNMYPRENMQHNNEWRHVLMQQQNNSFNQMRPNMQQGFNMNMQQMRNQQQVMGQNSNPMNNMNQMLNHMQQQQMMQQPSSQMSISNLHMQQSQTMSVTNQLQQPINNQLTNSNQNLNDFIGLEFLDNLPTTDSTFTDQELLNSFDSDSGFNLDF